MSVREYRHISIVMLFCQLINWPLRGILATILVHSQRIINPHGSTPSKNILPSAITIFRDIEAELPYLKWPQDKEVLLRINIPR